MKYSYRIYRIAIMLIPLLIGFLPQLFTLQPVLGLEEWENQPLTWYYDNLTDEDRKKIRQAFDYCIPRQQVIDGLMRGYAVPLATEIGSNIYGYDPTIQAREYNTSKALDLLEEVFGKRYDVYEDPNETFTNTPYFEMTLIAPSSAVIRNQYVTMFGFALTSVGIDVRYKWWNWNVIMPRLFLDPPKPIGANFDHDGYDAYFIGYGASTDPDYSGQYYNDTFVPTGDNSMYIERADLQEIIRKSLEDPIEANRLEALNDYQKWFYEWVPKFIIHQDLGTFPQDPLLEGFDPYNYGRQPWVHNLSHPTESNLTSLVPDDFADFNPLVSNSWYDSVPISNCFLSLATRRGKYNLSAYPLLANNWTSTPDGLNWTVNLKQGVLFDDGSEVTAEDVVETYRVAMNASTSTYTDDMNDWFASDQDIYAIKNYSLQMNLQKFFPYVTTQIFGLPTMKADQLREIKVENLKTDITNTHAVGLIGNGPYKVSAYETNKITLVLNTYYNGTHLGHNSSNGIWLNSIGDIETFICKVIKEAITAVTALETGTCDLMDSNQGIFGQLEDMEAHPEWVKIITFPKYGWQEMALNHYDPRWGLNPHDPRVMYPETTTIDFSTSETIPTQTSEISTSQTSEVTTSQENNVNTTTEYSSSTNLSRFPYLPNFDLIPFLICSIVAFSGGIGLAALYEKYKR